MKLFKECLQYCGRNGNALYTMTAEHH